MGLLIALDLRSGEAVSTILALPFEELLSSDKLYNSVLMDKPRSGIKCDLIDANLKTVARESTIFNLTTL